MAQRKPSKEGSEDDPYDIEYYERTGGKIGENIVQEIQDARREISNSRLDSNKKFKCSMLAIICLLLLNLITITILIFLVVNISKFTGGENLSTQKTFTEGLSSTIEEGLSAMCLQNKSLIFSLTCTCTSSYNCNRRKE